MRTSAALSSCLAVLSVLFVSACQDAHVPTRPADAGADFARKSGQGGSGTASAVVNFGDHEAGSPFPPAVHDESFHAKDKIVPKSVVIERGGEVRFEIGALHQVAIYEPGTEPGDIDATETVSDPVFSGTPLERIVYDEGRVALSPGPSTGHATWIAPPGTFDETGTYLMICTTDLHFLESNMYGWIRVR